MATRSTFGSIHFVPGQIQDQIPVNHLDGTYSVQVSTDGAPVAVWITSTPDGMVAFAAELIDVARGILIDQEVEVG